MIDIEKQLFKAVYNNNTEKVTKIVGLGVNINAQDDLGQTPIFFAAFCHNLSMVKKLVELGASLEIRDDYGYTLLTQMIVEEKILQNEPLKMIEILIECGASLTTYNPINGSYPGILPIHAAIKEMRSLNIVKMLLTKDTVNAKDIFGFAPLHIAVWSNNINIVNLLINCRYTDINQEDDTGYTPLMLADYKNFTNIQELLLAHGANPNRQNASSNQTHARLIFSSSESRYNELFSSKSSSFETSQLRMPDINSPEFSLSEAFRIGMLYESSPKSSILGIGSPRSSMSDIGSLESGILSASSPESNISSINSPGSSLSEASQFRMLDVNISESNTSDTSQHSMLAILGSPKSSLGSFTQQLKRVLNVDSSSSSESYAINAKRKKT